MGTAILTGMARSCHHNKSQRADPFVYLTHIIAGKTKYIKEPFYHQNLRKARHSAGYSPFHGFWGNARTNRIDLEQRRRGCAT
ncbi:hypothetical protein D2912_22640 [Klebsiella pneumoniae]|nr:hypothetical protein [Klebsiella pneumoniae]MBX4579162.1 hypothetical protein [Klebsiella pneumoniae]